MKREDNSDHDADDAKLTTKDGSNDGVNGVEKKEAQDVKLNMKEGPTTAPSNLEDTYKAEMPEDPLERIALAFCDRDGPLVGEFNEMVEAEEIANNDWEGFLQKKFRNMMNTGEVEDDDFKGFLQKMHEREVAATEPAPTASKRGRKGKKGSVHHSAVHEYNCY
jgi:hypothetical protein